MGFPVILQVVGYQNSGKTTVITEILKILSLQGIKTGVLKHHGHDEKLPLHDSGKDSERHRNAGAFITGISSSCTTAFSMDDGLPLEKGIEIYKVLNMDCILIEGYKKIQYPRIVLCRNENDESLIAASNQIIAIISERDVSKNADCPCFLWEDEDKWLAFIIKYILGQAGRERLSNNETF